MYPNDEPFLLERFTLAEQGLPNDAEVLQARGMLLQSMGRWAEAQQLLEQAVELSPRDTSPAIDLAFLYEWTGEYQRALNCSDRAIAVAPSPDFETWGHLARATIHWSWEGASPEARAALGQVPLEHDFAVWGWYWQEMFEGRPRHAMDWLESAPGGWVRNKIVARPTPLLAGIALEVMGEAERSREAYESARWILEQALQKEPDDPRLHGSLGIAYAALGRKDEAIREGRRAVELYPLSRDAFYGVFYLVDLAFIYALVDEHESACDQLETLLEVPSFVSRPLMRVDPRWDRLRGLPRFESLLETQRPAAADS